MCDECMHKAVHEMYVKDVHPKSLPGPGYETVAKISYLRGLKAATLLAKGAKEDKQDPTRMWENLKLVVDEALKEILQESLDILAETN